MSPVTSVQDFKEIIETIQAEAQASIQLLQELAGLEGYIAETYAQRCLAELFQNSDDSFSTSVRILRLDDCLVYANNGRPFSAIDFLSLCKSASSSKERGKSIGYRGIGFKSVVNICSNVIIASQNLRSSFDRQRTSALLSCNSAVPLVRIPHHLTDSENTFCDQVSHELSEYSTFFLFKGINEHSINQEFSGLSPEHFIFLRHLENISISLGSREGGESINIQRNAPSDTSKYLSTASVLISSDRHKSDNLWTVASDNEVSLAVKAVDGIPSRVLRHEALLHAYLPTQAISCLGARVNADFSTDPSRTRLKFDSKTEEEIKKVALLIADIVCELYESPSSLFWRSFVDSLIPYPEFKVLELQGNLFCSTLLKDLGSSDCRGKLHQKHLRLLPDAYKDIEAVGSRLPTSLNVFIPISASYSDAKRFLEAIGAKTMPLTEVLEFHSKPDNAIDLHACPVFLRNILNAGTQAQAIAGLYSFVGEEGQVVSALDIIKNNIVLDNGFISSLSEAFLSQRRAKEFLESLGLSSSHFGNAFNQSSAAVDVSKLVKSKIVSDDIVLHGAGTTSPDKLRILDDESKRRYGIQNWRLSEEVVAYYYRSLGYKVIDVSQANKGYDLEVIGESTRLCVEVKDIKDSIKGFSLTQNEYTEADILGESYILALVRRGQEDQLDIMLISNPGRSLQAFTTKRAKAYEFLVSGFKYSPNITFS